MLFAVVLKNNAPVTNAPPPTAVVGFVDPAPIVSAVVVAALLALEAEAVAEFAEAVAEFAELVA
tara:strand:+ start:404 stop:595 length:192 start_codon:yes stop_codon:yes gene_type:complete